MTRLSFLIIKPRSYDVIFIMQIRAKFQILSSVNLNVKTTFERHSVIIAFYNTHKHCINMPILTAYLIHRAHAQNLIISLCFVSHQPLVHMRPNFVCR